MTKSEEWDGALFSQLSPEWAARTQFFEICSSTNDEAQKIALKGGKHLSLVLAERQLAGRGRRGRLWVSKSGQSIAASLIVRPKISADLWARHALATGLALGEALETMGVEVRLKWPNDVLIKGKKVCGVLIENGRDHLVIGFGINVNLKDFTADLAYPATSLALELGISVVREEVLVTCLRRLEIRLEQLEQGFDELLEAWSSRCYLRGQRVSLQTERGERCGVVEGISASGGLLLKTGLQTEQIIQAHDIRIQV